MKKFKIFIIVVIIAVAEIINIFLSEVEIGKITRNKYSEEGYEKEIILERRGKKEVKNFYVNTLIASDTEKIMNVFNRLELDTNIKDGKIYGISNVEVLWERGSGDIKAYITCNDKTVIKEFTLTKENVENKKIVELREKMNSRSTEKDIKLPKYIDDELVVWKEHKDSVIIKTIELISILFLGIDIYINKAKGILEKKIEKQRQVEVESRMVEIGILYSIGESKQNIFENLSFKNKELEKIYSKYRINLTSNVNINKEILLFSESINSKRFREFVSLLIKYDYTGSKGFDIEFKRLVKDYWKEERHKLKEENEKQMIRITLPMFMIFISILIMVMSPALLSF